MTFQTCGKSGRYGPTLSNCRSSYSSYSWAQNSNHFTVHSGGKQRFYVPKTGTYRIDAYGARGGGTSSSYYGRGAGTRGYFYLTGNSYLDILVGQMGGWGYSAGSGGGGTFVYSSYRGWCIAVGGGGGQQTSNPGGNQYADATSGQCGRNGYLYGGSGGCGGYGGSGDSGSGASGGGGYYGNGGTGTYGTGGMSYNSHGTGGSYSYHSSAVGGYGGGGGTHGHSGGGGGGGGYSGGGGGDHSPSNGGGGGSRNWGTSVSWWTGSSGRHSHGYVYIYYYSSSRSAAINRTEVIDGDMSELDIAFADEIVEDEDSDRMSFPEDKPLEAYAWYNKDDEIVESDVPNEPEEAVKFEGETKAEEDENEK